MVIKSSFCKWLFPLILMTLVHSCNGQSSLSDCSLVSGGMPRVATAVVDVGEPKSTVTMNRATELRNQKIRQQTLTGGTSPYVTWRVQSQKRSSPPPTQNQNLSKSINFTPKQVNNNIKSRMELFENNKITSQKEQDIEIIDLNSKLIRKFEEIVREERSEKKQQLWVRTAVGSFEKNAVEKEENKENAAVVVKKAVESLEKKSSPEDGPKEPVPKEERKYRNVGMPNRQASVNIEVSPWQAGGKIVTDSDVKEVERILAQRRKIIDESIKAESLLRREDKPQTDSNEIVLRPISVASFDESLRESSGASLDVGFPKAIDFARHGKRPLWREVKGIQEAGLLDTLNKEARIRQEAKFELMLSEATYLHNLNILKGHYMKNIQKHIPQVVSEKDYEILFKHALDVRSCSEAFLEELDAIWQEDPMLDGIYEVVRTHTSTNFGAYIRYCRNMLSMSNHLKLLISDNESFRNLLEVLVNREGSQRLTLDSFLTAPMQRITKLPLLLKTILDKTDDETDEQKQCIAAYEASSKIANECDEVVNEMKHLEEMLKLSHEIEFADDTKSIPIVAPQRFLVSRANVKHFAFRDKAPKREKLQLILFNDLMLVTKRKSDKLFIVVDHCSKERLQVKEMENPTLYGEEENAKQKKPVVLTMLSNSQDKKIDLVVTFKDQNQGKEWLQMFAVEESPTADYEDLPQVIALQEHIAESPEELTLSPGDVVQLTGEPVDGWCAGEIITDGTKGKFPIEKTTKITSARVKAANLKAKKELRSSRDLDEDINKEIKKSELSAIAKKKEDFLTEENPPDINGSTTELEASGKEDVEEEKSDVKPEAEVKEIVSDSVKTGSDVRTDTEKHEEGSNSIVDKINADGSEKS